MITDQQWEFESDGTIKLHNTFDIGGAASLAKEATNEGATRIGKGSGEMRLMGYIPEEMWTYDPWLITAKKAARAGDMGEHTKYMRKFFEVHPEFAAITPKKYY